MPTNQDLAPQKSLARNALKHAWDNEKHRAVEKSRPPFWTAPFFFEKFEVYYYILRAPIHDPEHVIDEDDVVVGVVEAKLGGDE